MDAEILEALGQIAGIGGIALGVLLLVFRDVVRKAIFPKLTPERGYRLLRSIIVSVWSVAVLGVGAWIWTEVQCGGAERIATRGAQSPIVTCTQGQVIINIGGDAAEGGTETESGDPAGIETQGPQSPVVVGTEGDVKIEIGPGGAGEPKE